MKYFFYLFLLCFTQHSALVLASSFSSKTYSEKSIANIDHQLQYFIELERSSILETMAKAEAEGKALDINSLQIAYWQEVSDDCDQLSHILLRMGLHHGSFSAMKIINRLYHFNYHFIREFFNGQIQSIHEQTGIDHKLIEIKINFLDRREDRFHFAQPHVDSLFEDQDPEYPFKWSLVFSDEVHASNTLFYFKDHNNILNLGDLNALETSKKSSLRKDRYLSSKLRDFIRGKFVFRSFSQVDNLTFGPDTKPSLFQRDCIHSSPTGCDSRLPIHFYIKKAPCEESMEL